MRAFYQLLEGVYAPNIFKAFFMAGGPGSGKSYVAGKTTAGLGLKVVNSDIVFENYLKQARLSFEMPDTQAAQRDARRAAAKAVTAKRQDNYVEGRLGLVIDGTGKDYSKYFYHVKLTNFIWSVDMTNKSKQKMKRMNFLSQPRVRVRKQTIEKKNESILSVTRGSLRPQHI